MYLLMSSRMTTVFFHAVVFEARDWLLPISLQPRQHCDQCTSMLLEATSEDLCVFGGQHENGRFSQRGKLPWNQARHLGGRQGPESCCAVLLQNVRQHLGKTGGVYECATSSLCAVNCVWRSETSCNLLQGTASQLSKTSSGPLSRAAGLHCGIPQMPCASGMSSRPSPKANSLWPAGLALGQAYNARLVLLPSRA